MNFDEAIKAHSAWKLKLKVYLSRPDKSLDPQVVGADNKCELGQWIYSHENQYKHHDDYQKLKKEHARFHLAASDVIKKADTGKDVSEETALGANSPFSEASTTVVAALMNMKKNIGL